jgi:hypothetical protein
LRRVGPPTCRLFGEARLRHLEAVFATWEEAELMEIPITPRGIADAQELGVEPS